MIIRNKLRSSVLGLFICAAACFAMIFISGLLFMTQRQRKVDMHAPLRQSEIAIWGEIPGNLSYTYTKNLTIYSLNSTDSGSPILNLTTAGKFNYSMQRQFNGVTWNQTQSSVGYSEQYFYLFNQEELSEEAYGLNQNISTINMAAQSIWYQMNSMPFSWKAWQAISQISYLMFDQDLITRYYAYNAFFYFFYD